MPPSGRPGGRDGAGRRAGRTGGTPGVEVDVGQRMAASFTTYPLPNPARARAWPRRDFARAVRPAGWRSVRRSADARSGGVRLEPPARRAARPVPPPHRPPARATTPAPTWPTTAARACSSRSSTTPTSGASPRASRPTAARLCPGSWRPSPTCRERQPNQGMIPACGDPDGREPDCPAGGGRAALLPPGKPGASGPRQYRNWPPLTWRVCPVTCADSPERRKTASEATSSGAAIRPRGIPAPAASSSSSSIP